MNSSISPDLFPPRKMLKLVHVNSPDDGAGGCFHVDPFPVRAERDSKLYLADAWDLLQPAINIIFQDKYEPGVFCCSTIFRAVKCACIVDPGHLKLLFDLIKKECETHVAAAIQSLEKQSSSDPFVFLPLVYNCWLGFKKKMMFVSDIAMYTSCNGTTLWDVGQEVFHKQLSLVPQVQDKVIGGILGLITDERLGKTANNTSLLKDLMDMFHGQRDVFKKPFLDSTSKFYASEAKQVLQRSSDISHYLKYVEGILREEKKKCKSHYYFFVSCWLRLMKVVERELLEVHSCFLEEGFKVLMDESRMDDLRRMYCLFSRADQVGYIDGILRSYILAKGEGARQNGSLQELHTNIDKIWHKCFDQDDLLDESIRECFEGLGLHVPGEYSDQEQREEDED